MPKLISAVSHWVLVDTCFSRYRHVTTLKNGFFMIRTTLALLVTLGTQSAIAATVIHAGFLFDTKEGELLEKQTITIEGGRVVSVNDGFLRPEGSTVIDLSAAYVSPGFMDMHVHLDGELDPPASYSEEFFMNSADIALRSTVFARRTLDAGFTTVRDLGAGDIQASFALRDAIAKNIVHIEEYKTNSFMYL